MIGRPDDVGLPLPLSARFVEGGFKRLLTQGFNCENTRINYIPAYTAIGHSSVHTGSVPSIHGIAGE